MRSATAKRPEPPSSTTTRLLPAVDGGTGETSGTIQGQASHLLKGDGGKHIPEAGSDLGAVLQQAHHHAALVVLTTKNHGQHLDYPLLSARAKPSHSTILSQVTKAREEIVV